ncbi:MAG: CoA ester lyase [Gammaproteobacteria bacterium]|nr:MAG: CoA ester lyase [Gammaproteobacteria bacterium]
MNSIHPEQALFTGEKPFPVIPACDHYAGNEKLIRKALDLQRQLGPIFDVTCDCEDGAPAGREREHAGMVATVLNSDANHYRMAGVRIHDPSHPHWQDDIDIIVGEAGDALAHLTIPKPTSAKQVRIVIDYLQQRMDRMGLDREIPIHVLIETHGALREVWEIAAASWMQVIDFGLMDFISSHHGAIPASAMRSPGQFDHRLLSRAKGEIAAAALANGLIPAHNVTLDLKNREVTYNDARRARSEFGFLRMWSIYPAQIEPIVDAMKPDYDEVQDAAAILLEAQACDWGPIQYQGELQDRASYRYFWDLLRKARVTGVALPDAAQEAFFNDQS